MGCWNSILDGADFVAKFFCPVLYPLYVIIVTLHGWCPFDLVSVTRRSSCTVWDTSRTLQYLEVYVGIERIGNTTIWSWWCPSSNLQIIIKKFKLMKTWLYIPWLLGWPSSGLHFHVLSIDSQLCSLSSWCLPTSLYPTNRCNLAIGDGVTDL